LLGYNPQRTGGEVSPDPECTVAAISPNISLGKDLWEEKQDLAEQQLQQLVRLDHIQMEAATMIIHIAERGEASQKPASYTALREGDLVLLRRFLLDQRKGCNLEARWEGPYVLCYLAKNGKSGRLPDLHTGDLL